MTYEIDYPKTLADLQASYKLLRSELGAALQREGRLRETLKELISKAHPGWLPGTGKIHSRSWTEAEHRTAERLIELSEAHNPKEPEE